MKTKLKINKMTIVNLNSITMNNIVAGGQICTESPCISYELPCETGNPTEEGKTCILEAATNPSEADPPPQ